MGKHNLQCVDVRHLQAVSDSIFVGKHNMLLMVAFLADAVSDSIFVGKHNGIDWAGLEQKAVSDSIFGVNTICSWSRRGLRSLLVTAFLWVSN